MRRTCLAVDRGRDRGQNTGEDVLVGVHRFACLFVQQE
jgi:hypothetical protein